MKWLAIALVGLAAVAACDGRAASTGAEMSLRQLQPKQIEIEAENNFSRGDRRVLGVWGITREIPGLNITFEDAEKLYGVRMIEGTSDEWEGPAEMKYNKEMRIYASVYNLKIHSLVSKSRR